MTTTASAAHDTRARHTPTCQRCWLLRWPGRPLCAPEQRAKSAALAAGRRRSRLPRQALHGRALAPALFAACGRAGGEALATQLPAGQPRPGRAAVSVRGLPRRAAAALLLPLLWVSSSLCPADAMPMPMPLTCRNQEGKHM